MLNIQSQGGHQAAALGWEGVDVSLNMNSTWRSQVGVEFQSPSNVTWFSALVARARAAGMELGAYQLLRNARSATGINQCAPDNAFGLPNDGFDDMDLPSPLGTGLPCHNGGRPGCRGGLGCCSLCSATCAPHTFRRCWLACAARHAGGRVAVTYIYLSYIG